MMNNCGQRYKFVPHYTSSKNRSVPMQNYPKCKDCNFGCHCKPGGYIPRANRTLVRQNYICPCLKHFSCQKMKRV